MDRMGGGGRGAVDARASAGAAAAGGWIGGRVRPQWALTKERRRDEDVAVLGVDAELVGEDVVPVRLHRVPVAHNAARYRLRVTLSRQATRGKLEPRLELASEP